MSVTVIDHSKSFESNTLQKASVFLRVFAETVVNIAEPKTPKDTSRLRKDVLKQILGLQGKIRWNKTYAAIQEKKQFKHYTTPGTGPHYAENAIMSGVAQTTTLAKRAGLI